MTPTEAERYVASGRLEASAESEKPKKPDGGGAPSNPSKKSDQPAARPEDPAALMAAVKDAIGRLDLGKAENVTQSGLPKTEAIEAVLGYPVSAKERDAA